MHFTGMLAYEMDMVHTYSILITVISLIIPVFFCWLAFEQILKPILPRRMLIISSVKLGLAVVVMHYLGMAAMEMDADLRYLLWPFLLSVVIAVSAAAAAIFASISALQCWLTLKPPSQL